MGGFKIQLDNFELGFEPRFGHQDCPQEFTPRTVARCALTLPGVPKHMQNDLCY